MIKVIYVPCIFEDFRYRYESRNQTVFSIFMELRRRFPEIREEGICIQVRINGKILHPFRFKDFILKDGDRVTIIQGIGLETIIFDIALFLVGAGIASYTTAMTIATILVWAVVSIASSLLSWAISSAFQEKPSKPKGMESSPTYGWDGMQTQSKAGVPVPLAYGQMMLAGNIIGAYVSTDGDKNFLNMLIALCEGPVAGIMKEDLSGIATPFVDNPYITINDNFLSNFGQFAEWDFRDGSDEQDYLPGFEDIANTMTFGNPKIVYGSPYIYTTIGTNIEAIEVLLRCPALFLSNKNGFFPGTVVAGIYYRVYGTSPWTKHGTLTITGASQNSVRRSYRIDGLTAGKYDIKIDRETGDFFTPNQGDLYWDNTTEIIYDTLIYPYTALLKLKIQATDKLSGQVPNIKVIGRWKKVKNLETSVTEWSNNPIYCVNDILVSEEGGGKYITQSDINTDQFIEQADYCDEMVGDGTKRTTTSVTSTSLTSNSTTFVAGDVGKTICAKCPTDSTIYTKLVITSLTGDHQANGTSGWTNGTPNVADGWEWGEKRYEFDGVLDVQDDAIPMISQVCASFRCAPLWIAHAIQLIIDKKQTYNYIFNVSNIIAGSFNYSYSSMKGTPNFVVISFLDKNQEYTKQQIGFASYTDIESGIPQKPVEMNFIGAIRASQIYREARFHVWAYKYQDEQANFKAGIDSIHMMPGDVSKFQHDAPQWGFGGRVVSGTTTTVVLNKEIELASGETYQITIRQKTAGSLDTVETRTISTAAGFWNSITVSSPFIYAPEAYSLWIIEKTAINSKTFRNMSTKRLPTNEMEFVSSEYSDSVYSDTDVILPVPFQVMLPNPVAVNSVTDLEVTEGGITLGDGTWTPYLEVGFMRPSAPEMIGWDHAEIWIALDTDYYEFYGIAKEPGFKIDAHAFLKVGNTVYVKAVSVNKSGIKANFDSSPVVSTYITGKSEGPSTITGFTGTQYTDKIILHWDMPDDLDIKCFEIREGSDWDSGNVIATNVYGDTFTLFLFGSGWQNYMIKAIDQSGNYSSTAASFAINVTIEPAGEPIATLDGLLNPSVYSNTAKAFNSNGHDVLIAITASKVWDTGNWDSGNWDLPVNSSGYFETAAIDLGTIQNVMFGISDDYVEDGDGQSVAIQIATSDDDISYSAYADFVASQTYTCRYAKFKITLSTDNTSENIGCYRLDITAYNFGGLQPWQTATIGSSTQVTSDGYLVGYVTYGTSSGTSTIKTDAANPPTTQRASVTLTSTSTTGSMYCPVRKDDYYLITIAAGHTGTFYFIPYKS